MRDKIIIELDVSGRVEDPIFLAQKVQSFMQYGTFMEGLADAGIDVRGIKVFTLLK